MPFFIRAGKSLPVTCTEVLARLRLPPKLFPANSLQTNHLRFRISPETTIALGVNAMDDVHRSIGQQAELRANHHPGPTEMDAYERMLTDAMEGDRTLFARQDYVEEAWRIVDHVLKLDTPIFDCDSGQWGPKELGRVTPPGGRADPTLATRQ